MHQARRDRLLMVGGIVAAVGISIGLTLYALSQNINLFFTPTQVATGQAPSGHAFRVGGIVVPGSLKRDSASLKVEFGLTDGANTVTVFHEGILPDLFREGQGIVAQGRLESGRLVAQQVLAKHDENYRPPEVEHALQTAKQLGVVQQK